MVNNKYHVANNSPAAPVALVRGPVRDDGVEPFLRVQSNLSFVACFQLHVFASNVHDKAVRSNRKRLK